jgi:glycosyltransferase involved in cell wall biosynthesis
VQKYANEDLHGIIRLQKFVPHDEALQVMNSSDCLLLFLGHPDFSRMAVSGKTYEYIRSGRPILAVAYPGRLTELIATAGAGWTPAPDDVAGIKRAFCEALTQPAGFQTSERRLRFVRQFSFQTLSHRLGAVFREVSG